MFKCFVFGMAFWGQSGNIPLPGASWTRWRHSVHCAPPQSPLGHVIVCILSFPWMTGPAGQSNIGALYRREGWGHEGREQIGLKKEAAIAARSFTRDPRPLIGSGIPPKNSLKIVGSFPSHLLSHEFWRDRHLRIYLLTRSAPALHDFRKHCLQKFEDRLPRI